MKLDRNIPTGHGNKYGLIKNRRLEELRDRAGHLPTTIGNAILTLVDAGVLDWGCSPDTEFFVIRLKDRNAGPALGSYAIAAMTDDPEYANDVAELAARSGLRHPCCKRPDAEAKAKREAASKLEFEKAEWDGCTHLDCVPGCSHHPEHWRCERFERAFAEWIKR
jgi:hypothetical protein